jgi:hypothetical protein
LNRKYGSLVFLGAFLAGIVAVVGLLMFALTSMDCRARY